MTREEAIKVCTREKAYVQSELDACSVNDGYVSPDGIITAADYVEAMSMAISALREQEYKEPCDGCRFFADAREQDFGLYETVVFEFCPVCGRRLEEV